MPDDHSIVQESSYVTADDALCQEHAMHTREDGHQFKEETQRLVDEILQEDDVERGWSTALEKLEDHDKHVVDSWKDELNNLLVFAGLFSAVVTTFTVDSYKTLQQDSGDVSVQLLARISLQLESSDLGRTTVNSTTSALPLTNITNAFSPGRVAVDVNILWIVSLTLSLLAALYAIAVQQWLRQLRLPTYLSTQEAVRLLQSRHDGLRVWQVSGIVSLLPVLLQAAVILFLVGFMILLHSLNGLVANTLTAVGGAGVLIFFILAVLPLLKPCCPYKSSLVPAVLIALQVLSVPLVLVLVSLYNSLLFVSRLSRGCCDLWLLWPSSLIAYAKPTMMRLQNFAFNPGKHVIVNLDRFWIDRELATTSGDGEILGLARALLSVRLGHMDLMRIMRAVDFASGRWSSAAVPSFFGNYGARVDFDAGTGDPWWQSLVDSEHLDNSPYRPSSTSLQQAKVLLVSAVGTLGPLGLDLAGSNSLYWLRFVHKGLPSSSQIHRTFFQLLWMVRCRYPPAIYNIPTISVLLLEYLDHLFDDRKTVSQAVRLAVDCFESTLPSTARPISAWPPRRTPSPPATFSDISAARTFHSMSEFRHNSVSSVNPSSPSEARFTSPARHLTPSTNVRPPSEPWFTPSARHSTSSTLTSDMPSVSGWTVVSIPYMPSEWAQSPIGLSGRLLDARISELQVVTSAAIAFFGTDKHSEIENIEALAHSLAIFLNDRSVRHWMTRCLNTSSGRTSQGQALSFFDAAVITSVRITIQSLHSLHNRDCIDMRTNSGWAELGNALGAILKHVTSLHDEAYRREVYWVSSLFPQADSNTANGH